MAIPTNAVTRPKTDAVESQTGATPAAQADSYQNYVSVDVGAEDVGWHGVMMNNANDKVGQSTDGLKTNSVVKPVTGR